MAGDAYLAVQAAPCRRIGCARGPFVTGVAARAAATGAARLLGLSAMITTLGMPSAPKALREMLPSAKATY